LGADPHFFTDVEHGGIIPFTLTNHNATAHVNLVHALPHGFYGHLVSDILFALAHPTGRGDRRLFDHLNNLKTEGTFHGINPPSAYI
jgi:hypothetical protein